MQANVDTKSGSSDGHRRGKSLAAMSVRAYASCACAATPLPNSSGSSDARICSFSSSGSAIAESNSAPPPLLVPKPPLLLLVSAGGFHLYLTTFLKCTAAACTTLPSTPYVDTSYSTSSACPGGVIVASSCVSAALLGSRFGDSVCARHAASAAPGDASVIFSLSLSLSFSLTLCLSVSLLLYICSVSTSLSLSLSLSLRRRLSSRPERPKLKPKMY